MTAWAMVAMARRNDYRKEIAMAALVKKTGSKFARWFKELKEKNRPPYRWYEHDHYVI
jgi:hypothetical protein